MDKKVFEFISKQNNDPIVERKKCAATGKEYGIFASEVAFIDSVWPILQGKKYAIPASRFSPDERQRRRIAFRNFNYLYKTQCDASGQNIITMYRKPYTIYNNNLWRSDAWNPLDYGRDFDFSKTFTEQFAALSLVVPKYATHNLNCENSQYANMAANSKNCYLVFGCIENEDCAYGHIVWYSQDLYNCAYTKSSQSSYECIDCFQVTNVLFAKDCQNCSDSWLIYSCVGCHNCFGCVGLSNAQYCIFNKQYSKEAYYNYLDTLNTADPNVLAKEQDKLQALLDTMPRPACDITESENCIGDYIIQSKNVLWFDIIGSEDVKYGYTIGKYIRSQDVSYAGIWSEQCYQTVFARWWYNIVCGLNCQDGCRDMYYCDNCYSSQNCFGCVGIRDKQYCIFNKQYSKEEYERLFAKIIEHMQSTGEWGEFFDPSLSPFGYNETIANQYYPLSKTEAIAHGYPWCDYEAPLPMSNKVYKASELPIHTNEYNENVLQAIVECERTGKPFRIIKTELDFYRRMKLPLPRLHPDVRSHDQLCQRHPRDLFIRNTNGKEILSVYDSSQPFNVLDKEVYDKTFYG